MTHTQTVDILRDQIIFNEGDQGDCAYIIEKGRVLVYMTKDGEDIPISVLGEGEIFGEMSLIDNQVRSGTVKALEDVRLTIVTREQLLERISKADTVVQLLMRVLLKRLRRNNFTLGTLKLSDLIIENKSTKEDDQDSAALQHIKLENEIFLAFQNKEFSLHYQPIVNLQDQKIQGCEALLRWNSPSLGYVSPNIFIDIIENSSMVIPIGHWIISQALKDLKSILEHLKAGGHEAASEKFMMSINISGRQFTHDDFLGNLEDIREKHDVPIKNIKLEMTERIMLDGSVALDCLNRCHREGYAISIDDFGTGFSSLQYLTQMPISYLKVDRSFVSKVRQDNKSKAVVSSIIYLAKAMNIEVIAEGIENAEDAHVLFGLGAHYGQGYFFAKPLAFDEFMKALKV